MSPFAQMKALCKRVTSSLQKSENFEYAYNSLDIKVVLKNYLIVTIKGKSIE
jgi:hypothetical protein